MWAHHCRGGFFSPEKNNPFLVSPGFGLLAAVGPAAASRGCPVPDLAAAGIGKYNIHPSTQPVYPSGGYIVFIQRSYPYIRPAGISISETGVSIRRVYPSHGYIIPADIYPAGMSVSRVNHIHPTGCFWQIQIQFERECGIEQQT